MAKKSDFKLLKLNIFETEEYTKLLHGFLETYRSALVELGIKTLSLELENTTASKALPILADQIRVLKRDCLRCYSDIKIWQETNGFPVQEMSFQRILISLTEHERWEFYYSNVSGIKHSRRYYNFDSIEAEYCKILERRLAGNLYGPL